MGLEGKGWPAAASQVRWPVAGLDNNIVYIGLHGATWGYGTLGSPEVFVKLWLHVQKEP